MGDVNNVGALLAHIQNMQDVATTLDGLIEVAQEHDNDRCGKAYLTPLLSVMREQSLRLHRGLDSNALPEVRR